MPFQVSRCIRLRTGSVWLAITSLALLAGCGPSTQDFKQAAEGCLKFYQSERLKNDWLTEIGDHWTKDGKIVIELVVKDHPTSTSYTPRLCIVDVAAGKMSIPAVREQARWER